MRVDHINIIANELVSEYYYDPDNAVEYTQKWTTENVLTLNGEEIDVLWYLEECEDPVELIYHIKEYRFLTAEEIKEATE